MPPAKTKLSKILFEGSTEELNSDQKRELKETALKYVDDAAVLTSRALKLLQRIRALKGGNSSAEMDQEERWKIKDCAELYFNIPSKGWGGELIQSYLRLIINMLYETQWFLVNLPLPLTIGDAEIIGEAGVAQTMVGWSKMKSVADEYTGGYLRVATNVPNAGSIVKGDYKEVEVVSWAISKLALDRGRQFAIQTLIHEATHAAAGSADNGYIHCDGSGFIRHNPYERIDRLINNADSLSWFVLKIASRKSDTDL